jgi:hypothetical protein
MRAKLLATVALVFLAPPAAPVRGQFARPIPIPRFVSVPHFFPHAGQHAGSAGETDWAVILGVVGVVAAVLLAIYFFKKRPSDVRIRIVSAPPGEPPNDVRQAWVGLELPLAAREQEARSLEVAGALSGRIVGTAMGYMVDGKRSIELLALHDTHAAEWWRENAPHVLNAGYQFVFPAYACEKVS